MTFDYMTFIGLLFIVIAFYGTITKAILLIIAGMQKIAIKADFWLQIILAMIGIAFLLIS